MGTKTKIEYPRRITLIYPVTPELDTSALIFVEEGGVRIDNTGPLPPEKARRLRDWLNRYLVAAAEALSLMGSSSGQSTWNESPDVTGEEKESDDA